LIYGCHLSNIYMMWTNHSFVEAQLWLTHYITRMQLFVSMLGSSTSYVNLADD